MSSLVRWGVTDILSQGSFALDDAADMCGGRLIHSRDAIPLSVTVFVHSVTGTAPTYQLRIETDTGSGDPFGALYDANAQGTFAPTGSGYQTVTFATPPAALAAGTVYHLVVKHSAGTVNAANFAAIRYNTMGPWGSRKSFTFNQAPLGAWTTPVNTGQLICAINFAGGEVLANSASANHTVAVWGGTRAGMRFQLPIQVELTGVALRLGARSGSPSDLMVALLDASGNSVAAIEVAAALVSTSVVNPFELYFANPIQLSANQSYRLVARTKLGTEASSADSYSITAIEFGDAAWSFDGANAYLTQASADAGPWTDTPTRDVVAALIFDAVAQTTTLNTVDDVLDEGNWQVDAWQPRVADDAEFRAFVAGLTSRANAYVKWRVGESYYAAQAGSTNERVFREAEMQYAQYLLCLSAAKIADTSDHDGAAPWLHDGKALRETAEIHRARLDELLGPFDTIRGRPGRVGPYFRGVTTGERVVERFDAEGGG